MIRGASMHRAVQLQRHVAWRPQLLQKLGFATQATRYVVAAAGGSQAYMQPCSCH